MQSSTIMTPDEATTKMNHNHDDNKVDAIVLIATQSFTGEDFVHEILMEQFDKAGLHVVTKLVDECFTKDDKNAMNGARFAAVEDNEKDAASSFWHPSIRSLCGKRSRLGKRNMIPPVLLVASTFGDGDPPHHALEFANWLSKLDTASHMETVIPHRFAVFGLGDSTYPQFCAFGKYIDTKLAKQRGAKRLLALATGGKAKGNQAGAFEAWCRSLVALLTTQKTKGERTKNNSRNKYVNPFPMGTGTEWRRSAIQPGSMTAQLLDAEELVEDSAQETSFEEAKLQDNTTNKNRSVAHVTLSVALPPEDLEPGDHVGIYPVNDPQVVQRALDWLELPSDATTTILEKKLPGKAWQPHDVSAREFIARHVDLQGRATPTVLRSLLQFCGTLELRALARELTHNGNSLDQQQQQEHVSSTPFDDWLAGRYLTALDLAVLFECRPSLQGLSRACGSLQPRLYSIVDVSKDDQTNSTRIGLCIASAPGGLCSNYLIQKATERGSGKDADVAVFFQKSQFHLKAPSKPTILVAAGYGVGTCLGLIQKELENLSERDCHGKTNNGRMPGLLSHMKLFFGCRTKSELLYRDRLAHYQTMGLNLYVAYSREAQYPKTYVQDLIRQQASSVGSDLSSPEHESDCSSSTGGACVYVCGRLELLDGVNNALVDVANLSGGLPGSKAQKFVEDLQVSGRIITDCWSVVAAPTPFDGSRMGVTHDSENALPRPHRRPHVLLRLEKHHAIPRPVKAENGFTDVSKIPNWPSYLRLLASGELERRVDRAMDMWSACVACGRNCETNRLSSNPQDWGECRVDANAIVSSAFPHFGEEDCLRGSRGSGTIFFGACNLQCVYCQNWELSANDEGVVMSDERLAQVMLNLQDKGCHNINFVSPTHNVAPILRALLIAARKGLHLPLVWNTGGYDSVASLRLLDGVVDIYMPDAKYASRTVARRLSKVDNYPEINQAALKEMHRQVGDLELEPRTGLAKRGVLIRHLILPKKLAGTCDVMAFLGKEVSKASFVNVMDQYRPEHHAVKDKKFGLCKKPTMTELKEAQEEAKTSGLHRFDGEDTHSSYLDW